VKAGMQKVNIRGLVSIGGDGSLSIGQQLFEGGVPLVGVPKTIDNDLEGTVMTFDMVAYQQGSGVGSVEITEAVGDLKTVPPEGGFARTVRALGIWLGD